MFCKGCFLNMDTEPLQPDIDAGDQSRRVRRRLLATVSSGFSGEKRSFHKINDAELCSAYRCAPGLTS